jgi:hypothetical protein
MSTLKLDIQFYYYIIKENYQSDKYLFYKEILTVILE